MMTKEDLSKLVILLTRVQGCDAGILIMIESKTGRAELVGTSNGGVIGLEDMKGILKQLGERLGTGDEFSETTFPK